MNIPKVVTALSDGGRYTKAIQHVVEDNFTRERKAFYQNVTTGSKPKTSAEDYRQDLEW